MVSSWNMLRLFRIYFILSIQYPLNGSSPMHGETVVVVPPGKFRFIVSFTNKTILRICSGYDLSYARELAHFCGGSLITPHHVLTAAHCLSRFNEQFHEVEVVIGTTNLREVATVREVSWWRKLSHFLNAAWFTNMNEDSNDKIFDIAIVKLTAPVEDVELPTISYIPTEELYGKSVVIAGWGRIEENAKPIHMRMGTFTVIDPWADPEKYSASETVGTKSNAEVLRSIHFYTDALTGGTRPGDSGNPVLLYNREQLGYPNSIVGTVASMCFAMVEGVQCDRLNKHMSLNTFRAFVESVTNITHDFIPTVI